MHNSKSIDGKLLHLLLVCGHKNLNENINYLNNINVFPVSDGDTGTNMKRTFESGIDELIASSSFSVVFSSFIQGMLLGSRGNSGSILSQYYLGIYEYCKGQDEVSVLEFCNALRNAYKVAYQAVLQPVEGTMLTVMRESIENTIMQISAQSSVMMFFDIFIAELFACVQSTTNRLDVLRMNNVVDSGAAGLYLIYDGMKNGLCNTDSSKGSQFAFAAKNTASVRNPLVFRYCIEFLCKIHSEYSKEYFVERLSNKGDSLILSINQDMLKVHIHTNEPQNILDDFQKFGDLVETKIDDMLIQQELVQYGSLPRKHDGYMIISFVHGDGIIKLFEELGCDLVFTATQNYRISDDNFHFFISKFMDEEIIMLPNDELIYQTAITLYPPENYPNIHVVHSTHVIKTYFLLSLMIGTDNLQNTLKTFSENEESNYYFAKILSITIQQDKYFVGFTANETVINNSLDGLLHIIASRDSLASFSTFVVFHGQTVINEETEEVSSYFTSFDGIDFAMMNGEQDDFDYIIGAM